jgi:hypothetical protein
MRIKRTLHLEHSYYRCRDFMLCNLAFRCYFQLPYNQPTVTLVLSTEPPSHENYYSIYRGYAWPWTISDVSASDWVSLPASFRCFLSDKFNACDYVYVWVEYDV